LKKKNLICLLTEAAFYLEVVGIEGLAHM